MINPNPVDQRRSPYTAPRRSGLPKSISVPARTQKRGFAWKKLFFSAFLLFAFVCGSYTYTAWSKLNNALATHEGESSSALAIDPEKTENLNPDLFKKPGDGRFNLVIAGVGGDSHPGGNLTDSIQVISLDTINKTVGMTSLPRDLYVQNANGSWSKLNAVVSNGERDRTGNGPVALKKVVSDVLGATISNYVIIDFAGAKQLIDSLGGITVDVPKALNDPLFPADDMVKYSPFYVPAGKQNMNGTTALKYARSRETTSDFDRSARQQIIMSAIRQKALSVGTLSNPAKVLGLIETLGSHVKTDLRTDQIRQFASIYQSIDDSKTSSNVLDTSAQLGLLASSSNTAAGYIAYPKLGQGRYAEIHAWFQGNNPDPLIGKEAASVTVMPASATAAKGAAEFVETLTKYGYQATLMPYSASQAKNVTKTSLYQTEKNAKRISKNYLSYQLDAPAESGSPLDSGSDFEIIYAPSVKR